MLADAILLALAWFPAAVSAAAPTEYRLKAAFLLNFAKFVEWPASEFKNPQSPLSICIVGDDPFGRDLDETVKGPSAGIVP